MPAHDVRTLVARRRQPARVLVVLAGVPLAFMGVLGAGEGGGYFFVLASICLLQAAYPTLLGWGLVVAIYSLLSAIYLYAFADDLLGLARGHPASILTNQSDTVFFILLLAFSVAFAVALALNRPKPLSG
jgi:hypothetical protein